MVEDSCSRQLALCPACGYAEHGRSGLICPECGLRYGPGDRFFSTAGTRGWRVVAISSAILMVGFLILMVTSPQKRWLTAAGAAYFAVSAASSYRASTTAGRAGILVSPSIISVIHRGASIEVVPVNRVARVIPRFLDGRVILFDAAGNRLSSLPTGSIFKARQVSSAIKDAIDGGVR